MNFITTVGDVHTPGAGRDGCRYQHSPGKEVQIQSRYLPQPELNALTQLKSFGSVTPSKFVSASSSASLYALTHAEKSLV